MSVAVEPDFETLTLGVPTAFMFVPAAAVIDVIYPLFSIVATLLEIEFPVV